MNTTHQRTQTLSCPITWQETMERHFAALVGHRPDEAIIEEEECLRRYAQGECPEAVGEELASRHENRMARPRRARRLSPYDIILTSY